MPTPELVLGFLDHVRLLPRRLVLETPGVQATVPMLRGVWGAALHGLAPQAYHEVFSPRGPEAVPGYLLRPALDEAHAPALHWVLFGRALEHDEMLRRAWDVASGMGLGPQRTRWSVRHLLPLGPDGSVAAAARPWRLAEAPWPLSGPPEHTPCRLHFPAPLRLLRDDRLIEQPTLADLVVAASRRLEALLPGEERSAWRGLRDELLNMAREQPAAWRGARLDLVRWSASQQQELELRGIAGTLDLPDGPGVLWPLFAAACWLHLGKSTCLGLGELRVLPWVG